MQASRSFLTVALVLAACGGKSTTPPTTPTTKAPPSPNVPVAPSVALTSRHHVEHRANATGLEGVVRDRKTKGVLGGVTVVLVSPALQGEQVVLTDETGRFEFATLPPGSYTVTAYYADQQYSFEFVVFADKRSVLSIDLVTLRGETVVIEATPRPTFTDAMAALRQGAVVDAATLAEADLAKHDTSRTRGILAVARYGVAAEHLAISGRRVGGDVAKLRAVLVEFVASLDKVQEHLAVAARDPAFALELCVACMAGEDTLLRGVRPGLFDIERDRSGKELPDSDPRRQPTYHFDHGDLAWARAMVSFQQAFANIALAYDWSWIDQLNGHDGATPKTVTIRLVEPARIAQARTLILAGLVASDDCRKEFLAETDDDREWVPSPKQNNYASPLAVDARLYQTWEAVVGDVRTLVAGQTGLSLQGLIGVFEPKDAKSVPAAFLDFGAMLTTPKDIVFQLGAFDAIENEKTPAKRQKLVEGVLRQVLGNGYKARMKASPLTDRLKQIRSEIDKNQSDVVEDKLKYFLWLN